MDLLEPLVVVVAREGLLRVAVQVSAPKLHLDGSGGVFGTNGREFICPEKINISQSP